MKLEDLVKVYGLPIICKTIEDLKIDIRSAKDESLVYGQVEWWCLKFVDGKIYYYDPSKKDWELLEGFE
jgi:hypothetical protein